MEDENTSVIASSEAPEFDAGSQIRVLLFRELNGQERRLLFDSRAVRKRQASSGRPPPARRHDSSIEKSFKLTHNIGEEYVYEWQKSSSDETLLREMIFGAVSISFHGTTFKVHTIRSPPQIMLSLVFPAPPVPTFRTGEPDAEESGTWTSSIEVNVEKLSEMSDSHLAHSVPVDVPSRLSHDARDSDSDSLQSLDGHSSLPAPCLSPGPPPGCLPRSSSYNSLQRRIARNKATSIELGLPKSEDVYPSIPGQKKSKLGLSIVINLTDDDAVDNSFSNFLFTHISLVEGHLKRLRDTVTRAYLNRRHFVHLMFQGSKRFQQSLCDLYAAPRLQNPEWLTIISSPNHHHLSYSFLKKFSDLLKAYDKKETNFFMTTLLTAVLTHHLSWIPSVIPTDSKVAASHSSHKHTPNWVDLLAKSRPYNPLWVQLSDLYGALGVPPKLTKTVIKGKQKHVVQKFLRILSYFIRCSDICEHVHEKADEAPFEHEKSFGCATDSRAMSEGNSPRTLENSFVSPSSNADEPLSTSCASNSPCELTLTPTDDRMLESLKISELITDSTDSSKTLSGSPVPQETVPEVGYSESAVAISITNNDLSLSSSSMDSSSPVPLAEEPDSSSPVPLAEEPDSSSPVPLAEEPDSLGYSSLEAKLEVPSKRPALREQPSNCNLLKPKDVRVHGKGKENVPCESCEGSECGGCPCYGGLSKDVTFSVPKVARESESVEEGYHSMEEPHSPGKGALSEMLKRFNNWCPDGCEELPLPGLKHLQESTCRSFGWSLMAGVSDHYLPDFCLQGLSGPYDEDEICEDLVRSTHIQVLGESVSEAVCIVADTDKWSIKTLSSTGGGSFSEPVAMSSLVSGMCDAVLNMAELGIPQESCVIFLEDKLQEIYNRSLCLADFLRNSRSYVSHDRIATALNINISDLPLLFAVATTHSPNLLTYGR